jgi:branched-chain amino acid transport system permease protein
MTAVSLLLQIVVTGLAAGAVYGLFALVHTVVYELTGVVNFAFGDLVSLAVFATLLTATGGGPISQTNVGGPRFLLAVAVGVVVCVLASAASYGAAIQPYVARGWTVGWVAATVALAFAITTLLEAAFDQPTYVVPDPLPFDRVGREGVVTVAGATLQVRSFFVIAVGVVLAAIAVWFLRRTHAGKGLRAIADDAGAARTVGLPVDRLLYLAFGLCGALAAVAAIVAAPSAPFDVPTGTLLGVQGLVAALVVRFAGPWHALLAGLGLGLVETAIANLDVHGFVLGVGWSQVLPLAAVLALLAVRPFPEAAEELE